MVQHFVRVDDPGDRITQRMVLVDDTNPNVQYSGPWFSVQDTQTHLGNLGIPFQNTLHGVNVNATLSFPFSGMYISMRVGFRDFVFTQVVFRIVSHCSRDKHDQ